MTTSSRFAVAVHTLTLLAMDGEGPTTSDHVAGSVNTNPVVIRRILGLLREAGLVTSQPGAGGGATLAHQPEQITLLDVYRAVEDAELFSLHHQPPNPECACGRNIQSVLQQAFRRAEEALEKELAGITVAQVLQQVETAALSCDARSGTADASPGRECAAVAPEQRGSPI